MSDTKMRVAIGTDHGGFDLKADLIEALTADGYEIKDYGIFTPESADYPDIAKEVGEAILAGECERGILLCGTGVGMAIAANKIKGIRAGVCSDTFSAGMMRAHNDAQIIAIGARVVGIGLALEIARKFLSTEFDTGGRHGRRIGKITEIECSQ